MKRGRDAQGVSGLAGQRPRTITGLVGGATDAAAPPLYLGEGLLAVHKPLTWTSQDVVARIRGLLTADALERGYRDDRVRRRKPLVKVGHGGTLDPLASGVLVLGVGRGTSLLGAYLEGDKRYVAACQLGYETDTLDAEGKVVRTAPWEHVKDLAAVEAVVPKFCGKIEQIPPLYSAIRVGGKRLYEIARKDPSKTAEDVEIPKREVEIYDLNVSAEVGEEVLHSGVVDGPKYREAVQALEAAAAETAAAADKLKEESAAADDGNVEAKDGNADDSNKTSAAAATVKVESTAADSGNGEAKDGNADDSNKTSAAAATVKVESTAADNGNGEAKDGNADGNKATQEGREVQGRGKGKKRRKPRGGRNPKKKQGTFKKNLFDEKTAPALPPDGGALALPQFSLAVRCGGGTYMRSLVRDVGYELDTVATMTGLVRTKQGPFVLADALRMEDWNADAIYAALGRSRERGLGET